MAKNDEKHKPLPFKETAGTLTAFLVVIAFVAIGFSIMAAEVLLGVKIAVPGDWSAAMLSLASAALGFLIGKNDPIQTPSILPEPPVAPYTGDAFNITECPHCGMPTSSTPPPDDRGAQI